MVWLVLKTGIQILGFGFTLIRLAYDEWQRARISAANPGAGKSDRSRLECEPWRTATT